MCISFKLIFSGNDIEEDNSKDLIKVKVNNVEQDFTLTQQLL